MGLRTAPGCLARSSTAGAAGAVTTGAAPGTGPCTGAAGGGRPHHPDAVSFSAISISVSPGFMQNGGQRADRLGVDRNARHSATPTNSAIAVNAKPYL